MIEDYLLKFAKVKFGYGSFTYDYLCGKLDLVKGDKVLVPTKKGPKEATVVSTFSSRMEDMELPAYRYIEIICKCDNNTPVTRTSSNKRFVNVQFNLTSYKYSYACEDKTIGVGAFVNVRAAGKVKTAKVVEVFYSDTARFRSIVGRPTQREIDDCMEDFIDEIYGENPEEIVEGGYHDWDFDEDDWVIFRLFKVRVEPNVGIYFCVCSDESINVGDRIVIDMGKSRPEATVLDCKVKFRKNLDRPISCYHRVITKLYDNPNKVQREKAALKSQKAMEKHIDRAEKAIDAGFARVEKHQEEICRSNERFEAKLGMKVKDLLNLGPTVANLKLMAADLANDAEDLYDYVRDASAGTKNELQQNNTSDSSDNPDILYNPLYDWHPMNVYNLEKKRKEEAARKQEQEYNMQYSPENAWYENNVYYEDYCAEYDNNADSGDE